VLGGCVARVNLGSECEPGRRCGEAQGRDAGLTEEPPPPEDGGELDGGDPDAGPPCEQGALGGEACACAPLPAPLAHYRLDDGAGMLAVDSAPGLRQGALVDFSSEGWTEGHVAGALAFDGVDDYVDVGGVSGSARTVSLWIKADSTHVMTSETSMLLPTAHGPLNQWSNPEWAYSDDTRAAYSTGVVSVSSQQHWGGFHLDQEVPDGAEILGISVIVKTSNLGVLGYFSVELSWDGGASHTNAN
jgi:hypothetical protein